MLASRTEANLQVVAEEIKTEGGEAIVVAGDVSKVQLLTGVGTEYI